MSESYVLGNFSKGIHYDEVIPFSQKVDPNADAPNDIHPEYFLILPKKFEEEEERKRRSKNRKRDFVPKNPSKSKFDEWVYVLKNSVVKSEFTAAGIQEAGEKLDILKMTPQQKAEYEAELIALAAQKSELQTAEMKGEEKGRAEGRAEGEEIGLQKGEEIGLQKEKTDAVIRGHNKGHSIDKIAEFTDLTTEQIIKILKENGLQ